MYRRKTGAEILQRHAAVQPRMRAILLDWLIEVSEVYRLHRETFYLAVDFIDRYLSVTSDLPKTRLQLIGECPCRSFKSPLIQIDRAVLIFELNLTLLYLSQE